MRILAFDTATRATTVALDMGEGEVLEARDDPGPGERPRHTAMLLPLADQLLAAAGIELADVRLIAVGLGPGTFTGLRIGIATARGLSQALGIPIVGVSTLQSLALGGREHPSESEVIAPVLDARRGEVFAAAWPIESIEDRDGAVLRAAAIAPEALADRLSELGQTVLAIGEGAVEFRTQLERSGAAIPEDRAELHRVTAVGHCQLARRLQPAPADRIVPDYLRLPDAKPSPTREQRPARSQ